jgi:erythronate-4-phosphate dehydrogenase
MKCVVDVDIPYLKGVLESYAEVVYLPGNQIKASDVKDADVLVTRTRTVCNEALLSGSSVRFIATATIGYDHIDASYCARAGITWVNAPGCNSSSVDQYVASALFVMAARNNFSLEGKTIGVVGVGNVGSKVARTCRRLGMRVLLNDPPRARREGEDGFCTLRRIQQEADVITFHVPLCREGVDATFRLADEAFFQGVQQHPILINTCRGEVVDSAAALRARTSGQLSGLVLDCWENEPLISRALLDAADLGTPHIAGYSRDGKANATTMVVRAIGAFFNVGLERWTAAPIEAPESDRIHLEGLEDSPQSLLARAVWASYDVRQDDAVLRADPGQFEQWRRAYPVRREYPAYCVPSKGLPASVLEVLKDLGFRTFE